MYKRQVGRISFPRCFFLLKALQAGVELGQAQLKLGLDFSEDLVTIDLLELVGLN